MGLPSPIQVEHTAFESVTEGAALTTRAGRGRRWGHGSHRDLSASKGKTRNEPHRSQLHTRPRTSTLVQEGNGAMANEMHLRGGGAQLMFRAKAFCRSNASNLAVKVVTVNGKEGGVNLPLRGGSRVDALRDVFCDPDAPMPTVDDTRKTPTAYGGQHALPPNSF